MPVSFKKREIFKTEVTIPVPNDKGGFDNNTFVAHFKHTTYSQLKALRETPDLDAVRASLVGWDMVDEETRQPVPYSEATRDELLEMGGAPYHLALAFFKANNGNKAKN